MLPCISTYIENIFTNYWTALCITVYNAQLRCNYSGKLN